MRKALFILGMLDDSGIDWMTSVDKPQRIPGGTTLIMEGLHSDSVHIVVDGAFAVRLSALGGKDHACVG